MEQATFPCQPINYLLHFSEQIFHPVVQFPFYYNHNNNNNEKKSDVSYCFGAYGNVLARMRALLQQMLYKHDSLCPRPHAAQHPSTMHSKLMTSKSDSQLTSLNKMDLKTSFPKPSGLILALETSHRFCYAIHVSCTSKSVEGKPARLA